MKNLLSDQISRNIQERCTDKLQKLDKDTDKKRKALTDPAQLAELDAEYKTKRIEIENHFIPSQWLSGAADRAKQISIVTHALKFTHTDAKGSSVYMSSANNSQDIDCRPYLSTASLQSIEVDIVGNAAALDVAGLLQLEHNEESLMTLIARNDDSSLRPFADSETQLSEWMSKFQQVLKPKELSSHTLAKQLFFPINDSEYHLLSPLFASSLTQALHQRIHDSRFSEVSKEARKARRDKKFSKDYIIDYPGVLTQSFGGTKPQNVSKLNSARGGKSYLLSCAPPIWDNKHFSVPLTTTCVIKKEYSELAWRQVKELQKYLLSIQKKRNKECRLRRVEHVDELISILLSYAARVRNLPPGWSEQSQLPRAQQLWLDPNREDSDFQKEREKNDWRKEISSQFSLWLNQKIKHDKLSMADSEYQYFHKSLKVKLKELEEDLEVIA